MNAAVHDFAPQLASLGPEALAYVQWQLKWLDTARMAQLPPDADEQAEWLEAMGDHAVCSHPAEPWIEFGAMAGRGFGKTRVGAEWLGRVAWECTQGLPYSVIAPTQSDVRLTCFEGESGLLSIIPPECVDEYNRGELILKLGNGAMIRGFSAEKADRLRGPQHASVWSDEIAAWQNGEDALDMMEFGLRLGTRPRHLWTSTPRPNAITRRLAKPGKGRILVRGATNDNAANLAKVFLDKIRIYEGTKLGRQELDGELIDAEEAGIIRRSWLNLWPAGKPLPPFEMIIMSLDTAFTEKTIDKSNDPDPTACGVWGLFRIKQQAHVLLLDCWEDHLGLPDLVRKVKKEIEYRYGDDNDQALITPLYGSGKPVTSGRKPDVLLIEDKGSGISLRQTMAELGVDAWAYNPGRADKLSRLHIVSPVFAQRRVWVPESSKLPGKPMTWAEGLIGQLCTFAGEGSIKHDDHVDQTTQALRVMMDKGMLSLVRPAKQQDVAATPPAKPVENPYAV